MHDFQIINTKVKKIYLERRDLLKDLVLNSSQICFNESIQYLKGSIIV
jgi:hypothetical protein